MINQEIKIVLKELGKSDYGDKLKEYLSERLEFIKGDIDDVEDWPDVLARRKAKKIIKEVFYFLEAEEPQQKEKNQYM